MQPFVLQHTCTRTHTHTHKISSGRSYENYYFHIVDDKGWKNHLKPLWIAKASTSILKLSKRRGKKISPGRLVVRLHCGFAMGELKPRHKVATFRKLSATFQQWWITNFTIWLYASSFKSCKQSLKCLALRSRSLGDKNCTVKHEITDEIRGNGLRLKN